MSDKYIFTARFTPECAAKLDLLTKCFHFSKNEYIGILIDTKYDYLISNPEFNECVKVIQEFHKFK